MERRDFLKSAGLGLAASTALAAPAIAQSAPELRWRLTSSFPRVIEAIYGASEVFCKAINEATDGKFQIQPHPAGELVPPLQAADAVQSGSVEVAHTASYYYFGKDPTFAFGTALPFGLNARQQSAWLHQGGGTDLLNAFYANYNTYAIPGGNTGAQMGGWFRQEIKTAQDLSGLKMRVAGLAGRVLSKLGVLPQQIGAGEIYQALERGTIDAVEFVGPYDDERLGLQQVAKFYYYPGWWEGGPALHFFINAAKWNELPKTYQSIVKSAAALAEVHMITKYDAANPPALRRLVAKGAQLRPFPRDVMESAYKFALEFYTETAAANPAFKKMYDSWKPFRDEQYLWSRVAENSFENFVYSQQAKGQG